MAEIKPYMPFLNAADVGNIEVVAMQHQAVGPYYCNNFDQHYHQQQQQPLPVQQQTEFPHTNISPYYSAMQSLYQVPGGGGPNVNIYQQPPPPVQQQQQQHSPQNATTHMSIVTQQPSPLYQEHHVSASNRISIQPDLVPINSIITPQLQQPLHINPRAVTLPNGRIKCMECDKDFTKPCYLTQHINSLHSGEYPYRCIKCGKRYKTTESYEVHISRHGSTEKREKCNQCSKQFCHKSDLKRHVSIKHTGDKQHICEVCSKSFSRADHLHKHKKVHSKAKRVMIGKDSVGQKTDEKVNVETKSNEANENGEMGASLIDLIDEYLLKMDDIDCNNRTDNDDFSISEFLKPYLAY